MEELTSAAALSIRCPGGRLLFHLLSMMPCCHGESCSRAGGAHGIRFVFAKASARRVRWSCKRQG